MYDYDERLELAPRDIVARAAAASRSTRVVKRKANYRTVNATIEKVGKKIRASMSWLNRKAIDK